MAEPGGGEGHPHAAHKQEAKHTAVARHTIEDSAATPRHQPAESKEDLQARILQNRLRIEQSVKDAEKLLQDAIKFPDISQPAPSKNTEQQKTGIRGLINRLVGRSKSTEPPPKK